MFTCYHKYSIELTQAYAHNRKRWQTPNQRSDSTFLSLKPQNSKLNQHKQTPKTINKWIQSCICIILCKESLFLTGTPNRLLKPKLPTQIQVAHILVSWCFIYIKKQLFFLHLNIYVLKEECGDLRKPNHRLHGQGRRRANDALFKRSGKKLQLLSREGHERKNIRCELR